MPIYRYCGLEIDCAFDFPELTRLDESSTKDAIAIELGPVGPPAGRHLVKGPNWAVGPDAAYWWLDDAASFRIDPEGITIDANASVEFDLVRAVLLEAPMVLAMQFRGAFCLAVSAISNGKTATAMRFLPGGGSSTAAAWQVANVAHCKLMSDTLLRVSVSDSGQPMAWPQGSGAMLWPKSVEILGLTAQRSRPIRRELALRRIDLEADKEPRTLETILTAALHRRLSESTQEDLNARSSKQPFSFAATRTAGRLWIDPMGLTPRHFEWCLSIARHCTIRTGRVEDFYS